MRILAKFQGKSGLQNEKRPRTCFRVSLIRFRNTAAKTSTRLTEDVWLAWVSALSHVNVQARELLPAVRPLIEWTESREKGRTSHHRRVLYQASLFCLLWSAAY